MGIMDFVKEQFIDVIEYVDESNYLIVSKYERPGDEIKQGAKLIVRESQAAVFLKGGRLADILYPGTYTLNTENLPVLSSLEAIPYLFNSPIKSDLYFVSTRQFTDNKWGTKNPIILRDAEFNMVRVTAFGMFSFRISDVELFMKEIFGTIGKTYTYDIIQYLTAFVSEAVAQTLGEIKIPVLDLAVKYRELSSDITDMVNQKSTKSGIEFVDIIIESISLPEEVEKLIDEQAGIGMAAKDMGTFMQYQTARAMRDASKQEGGLAGLGAGMAVGNQMAGNLASQMHSAESKSSIEQLKEYKELLDSGIITQEEFNTLKKKLLNL